jgi:hypothetical protein
MWARLIGSRQYSPWSTLARQTPQPPRRHPTGIAGKTSKPSHPLAPFERDENTLALQAGCGSRAFNCDGEARGHRWSLPEAAATTSLG